MTKKVTLDKLDVEEPVIESAEEHPPDDSPEENTPGKAPHRWYRSRMFLISAAAFSVICCAGLFLFFFRGAKKEARHVPSPAESVATQPQSAHSVAPVADVSTVDKAAAVVPSRLISVEMNDFFIPLKDSGKNGEVLALDVTVQIDSSQQELFQARIALIRGGIYKALQDMTADIPRGKGGMVKVREKVTAALGISLGDGFVKEVWLCKFIVL
jgi:flagellar basal body-associated protein FliL